VPAGLQNPGDLGQRRAAIDRGDEIEEIVGVRESAAAADLEGDPAFGVEANPGRGGANPVRGAIDSPYPRGGELTGQEEGRVAVAAFDLEYALGRRLDLQDGDCERGQRRGGHGTDRTTAAGSSGGGATARRVL